MEIQHLEIPVEWGERKEHWRDLTSGGRLFAKLQDCVRKRSNEGEFREMLDLLDRWRNNYLIHDRIEAGVFQWNRARELTELAQLASTQPPSSTTQPIERIFLPHLSAWQWDAVCALRSIDRRALPNTTTSMSVLMEQGNRGYLARLDVELMAEGNGEVYADSRANWFVEFDPQTFLKSASDEWERIKSELETGGIRLLERVDARFRLTRIQGPDYPSPELVFANGRSAQVAFHLCLKRCADTYLGNPDAIFLDQSVAASATIEADLKLGGVDALDTKMRAAYLNDLAIVIVSNKDEAEAKSDLESAKTSARPQHYSGVIEVIGCATVADAIAALRERAKEKFAVLDREYQLCRKINLLDQSVPIEKHYQVLPLMQEVKRERLPRMGTPRSVKAEDDPLAALRISDVARWEEAIREDQVTTEQHALKAVFRDFRSAAKDAKSSVPRFFLLGPPGSGKSTLTQFLAWACTVPLIGRNSHEDVLGLRDETGVPERLVPARVTLRDWEKWATKSNEPEQSLPEYLARQGRDLVTAPTSSDWRKWLRRGEVLLLFDGLDEIAGAPRFVDALKAALIEFAKSPTVVTCRTVSFEQHRAIDRNIPVFTLAGLNDEQRDAFIRSFPASEPNGFDPEALIDQLNGDLGMRPLAANPLLLSIICYVASGAGLNALPSTRGELYDRAIDRLLRRTQRIDVPFLEDNEIPPIRKRRILERVALVSFAGMDEQRHLSFGAESLIDGLTSSAEQEGYVDNRASVADALLKDFVFNSGILRGDADRGYFFLHLTIHEFLAASAIARAVNNDGWKAKIRLTDRIVTPHCITDCKSWDPRWGDVMNLLAGQLRDPSPLLSLLADEKRDDMFRHRLALAAISLQEINLLSRNSQAETVREVTKAASLFWWDTWVAGKGKIVRHYVRAVPSLASANALIDGSPLLTLISSRLRDGDANTRSSSAMALGELGKTAAQHPDVIPALLTALGDEDSDVRHRAVNALGQMGEAAADRHPDVIPALLSTLRDENSQVCRSAVEAFGQMCKAGMRHPDVIPALLSALRDEGRSVRRLAADALGQIGDVAAEHPDVIPALLTALRDVDWQDWPRHSAVIALGQMSEAATIHPDVIPALLTALRDENVDVRWNAAMAFGELGKAAAGHPDVIPALLTALRDEDSVSLNAALDLGYLGKTAAEHPDVIPALLTGLRDEVSQPRHSAAVTLCQMGEAAAGHPDVIPALLTALDDNLSIRFQAEEEFRRMGDPAARNPDVIPTLLSALRDEERSRRRRLAAEAFSWIGEGAAQHPDVIPALLNALRDETPTVQFHAARALGEMGEAAVRHSDVIPALLTAMRDIHGDDWERRTSAADALSHMGEAAAEHPDVIPALLTALCDETPADWFSAAKALGKIGQAAVRARDVIPTLLTALRAKDWSRRRTAADVIGEMGEAAARQPDVIPTLLTALRDEVSDVRASAANAIGGFIVSGIRLFCVSSAVYVVKTVDELSAWERSEEFDK